MVFGRPPRLGGGRPGAGGMGGLRAAGARAPSATAARPLVRATCNSQLLHEYNIDRRTTYKTSMLANKFVHDRKQGLQLAKRELVLLATFQKDC